MQRVDSFKDVYSNSQNANQYLQLMKNVFMNCPIHKYEPICYINISQKNVVNQNYYESSDGEEHESQTSEEAEELNFFNMKSQEDQLKNADQSNRFLCAECNLVNDIDKKNLLPLRKLIFNQERLYNNWPPLEQDLNKKVYDTLQVSKEQHECMIEIEKTCQSIIDQFSQQVNALKKDLMRIEGERYHILADLQNLYTDVSGIDKFRGILTQQQQQTQQQQTQLQSQQIIQNQFSTSPSLIQDCCNLENDNPLQNIENLFTETQGSTNNLQPQPLMISKSNSQQQQQQQQQMQQQVMQQNLEEVGSKEDDLQSSKILNSSSSKSLSTIDVIRKKVDEFLSEKYSEKKTNSQKLVKLVQQLNKFKPLDDNMKALKDFSKKMQLKLGTLSNQIKFKLNLTDFQLQRSQFKNSSLLHIDRNYKNQITIHTQGQIWGQVYSDFILENHLHYQFVFQFKQEVQNFIIIGLIPDAFKDQISQGSSQNHFGKIFGQENITYCGSIAKGNSQLSFLKKNDIIMMEVCVAKNHLTFSDYPNQHNITKLHSDYNLNANGKYRMCIEFYDFEEENTITLIDAKCY